MTDRLLALDIGTKRIGLAAGSVFPTGLGVLDVSEDEAATLAALGRLVRDEAITAFVVGLPLVKSGDETPSLTMAKHWVALLEKQFSLPVYTLDEAYSSVEAERQLRQEGVDTAHDKARIDERAAMLLLEQYLQSNAAHA